MIRLPPRRGLALRVLSLCAAGLFLASAGAVASAAGPDLSTPKKAAVSFAKAIEAGDMDAVKAASVGTDEGYQSIKLLSDVVGSMKKFQAAVVKKFGGAKLPVDMTNMVSTQFEAAEEKVEGDSATLVIKQKGEDQHPPKLKKVGAEWKVDLTSMLADPEFAKIKELAPRTIAAVEGITKEVEAGKFKSVEEAFDAFGSAMQKASADKGGK